jgi:hypothetical protein
MDIELCGRLLSQYWKIIPHFATSSLLGFAGYWLMLITLSRYSSLLELAECGILRLSLCVGFVFALSAHLCADYLLRWF